MRVSSLAWPVASAVLVASVPIVLIVSSLNALFYDPEYYAQGEARWAVGRTTEYSLDALRPINRAIVEFFRTPAVSLPTALQDEGAPRDVFNVREVGHMNDVRDLVRGIDRLQNFAATLAITAVLARFVRFGSGAWRWTATRLGVGAALTLGVVAVFGALTLVDFEQLFLTFHLVSFDNDLWELDPRKDNLIRFFPFEFWYDATVTVAIRTVLSAVAVGAAAVLAGRWLKGGIGEHVFP